jgi:hypothetical protein
MSFFDRQYVAFADVEAQLQLAQRRQRRVPYSATMVADRDGRTGASFLVPHARPDCDDYRAIPLMLRAERRAFHRPKDMRCADTGAPLRAPAQAPQASPLRI